MQVGNYDRTEYIVLHCVCVCVYAHVCTCMCVHNAYTCVVYIYMCTFVCVHVCICTISQCKTHERI